MATFCERCEYASERRSQDGWKFIGCFCKPNKGKFVTEPKDYPIGRTEVFNH